MSKSYWNNRADLSRTSWKLSHAQQLTIGYLGGSLTNGADASDTERYSWRAKTTAWLTERFPDAEISEINAAIGGTGSDFGVYRIGEDLLRGQPDLVFVEFTVNDSGRAINEPSVVSASMEGIIRRIYIANPHAEIVFIYTTMKRLEPFYLSAVLPPAVRINEALGEYYGISSVNIGEAFWRHLQANSLDWQVLLPDDVHPGDEGYALYSQAMTTWLESLDWFKTSAEASVMPEPLHDNIPLEAQLIRASAYANEDWSVVNEPCEQWPDHLFCERPEKTLTIAFTGNAVGVAWISADDAGVLEYSVDGGPFQRKTSWTPHGGKRGILYGNVFHNPLYGSELKYGHHTLTIRVSAQPDENSTANRVRIVAFIINGKSNLQIKPKELFHTNLHQAARRSRGDCSPKSQPCDLHDQRSRMGCTQGSAVIISLLLMSFLLLLILSLVAMVSVETHSAQIQKTRLLAEQNALLALHVGLGELQESMGPDRRVSALAEIMTEAQPQKGRAAVDVQQSKWTGVWNAEGGLHNWLVSGNEGFAAPASVFVDAVVNYDPSDVVTGLAADQSPDAAITIAGEPGVVLVASGSVGDTDVNSVVAAPRVGIDDQNAYAWWIADEGVKARADLVDRYQADGDDSATARFTSAQRNAMELMDGFAGFDPTTADVANLDKLLDYPDVGFLSVTEDDQQTHFHDVTLDSKGLLTDTRNGGLKRDLTYLFELEEGALSQPGTFLNELPNLYQDADVNLVKDDEGTTPIAQMAVTTPAWYFTANPQLNSADFQPWQMMGLPFGPTWEQLRSFYRLKDDFDDINDTVISVRPQREDQAGVYPIVLQMRAFTGISRAVVDQGADELSIDDDLMDVFAHFRIMFVLANPYSVDMDVSDMYFTIYMRGGVLQVARQDRSVFSNSFGKWINLFNHRRFHITAATIPAGEARIFTLDDSGAGSVGDPTYKSYEIDAATDGDSSATLVTHELINDFDLNVTLRCRLPGGPYSRADTNNIHLRSGGKVDPSLPPEVAQTSNQGGSDSVTIAWRGTPTNNPVDYRDVLQFSGATGGYTGGNHYGVGSDYQFSYAIDAATGDGEVVWGGGARWLMQDLSSTAWAYGNYIRELNIRAPHRNSKSDAYNPAANQNIGGQSFPIPASGSTGEPHFGDGPLQLLDTDDNSRAGWGMLYGPYAGQSPHYVNRLFQIPTSEAPVSSLGQLQHFNAGGYIPAKPASAIYDINYNRTGYYFNRVYDLAKSGEGYDDFPTLAFSDDYAIGNSFSSRFVERDRVYHGDTLLMPRDASWLLNAALWDRFYFSSMPQNGTFDVTADKLINNRYRPMDDGLPPVADALRASSTSFAEKMGVEGSFNVNSTSVEAWKAFLASTLGVPYQGESNVDEAVFARTPRQDSNPAADGDSKAPLTANAWKGYRALTLTEIDALAGAIVHQVKLRGPFLSLEHFVNRLPVDRNNDPDRLPLTSTNTPNGIGIRGALQAAIEASELNPLAPDTASSRFRAMDSGGPDVVDIEHGFGTMIDGGPGQITQGDLLQPLGPYISVRSDTFKIRCSGIVNDPLSGDLVSQVWCEAVVQRLPEFVDGGQAASTSLSLIDPNGVNDVNRQFGRRFKIVSLRWLDKNEI